MKKDRKLKGQLKLFLQWPVIMAVILILMNMWILMLDQKAGLVMGMFVLIYTVAVVTMYFYSKSMILNRLINFATQYGFLQSALLKDLDLPYAIMLDDGQILWANDSFHTLFVEKELEGKYLSNFIHDLNRSVFPKEAGEKLAKEVMYKERLYEVEFSKIHLADFTEADRMVIFPDGRENVITVTFNDVTDLHHYMEESDAQKLVAGLIYIDNYEEVMESVEEVRQSLLVALIDRKINQYMSHYDGLVRKLEKDKYFFVVKKACYKEMEKNKFSILEEAKTVNIGNSMAVTLSIGMGITEGTYTQSYTHARVAIDLALARGGDQAVIKDRMNFTFYGGRNKEADHRSKVRSRITAGSLMELIGQSSQVFVMGHKNADLDAIGAAVGVCCLCRKKGKTAHIVLDMEENAAPKLIEQLIDRREK